MPHFVFGSRQTPIDILLVEDNPGGVDLTRDALEDGKIRDTLHTVDNGEKTMRFLRRETRCSEAPGPDLVLLDLNLPRRDGREALAEIETDPDPRSILVVIVTASSAEADALKSYNPHANCYITRPIDLHQFLGIVKSIEHFWLAIVVLPPNGGRRR
ncbi:response regulator [Candidatus Sumerlaeota bacterium]|nr:response regulator [Candidatus Sumerlaeota bacterium]